MPFPDPDMKIIPVFFIDFPKPMAKYDPEGTVAVNHIRESVKLYNMLNLFDAGIGFYYAITTLRTMHIYRKILTHISL